MFGSFMQTRFSHAVLVVCGAVLVLSVHASAVRAQACVGCTPLDDTTGPMYLGTYPLGLYPGVSNTPPAAHLALAMLAAANVVPRDAAGFPDADGLVGMLSIGMSNTNQEFAAFERAQDVNLVRDARLVILDGAVGGQSAEVIMNPLAPYWNTVDARVAATGLDPDQIQVVWLKEADGLVATTAFPDHADTLETHLRAIVTHLKDRFPQLQLCFVSSRIYGGYSSNPARNEPLSYETAFAYRNLIDAQASGDPTLNADAGAGPVEAPVVVWGPYLWANGIIPRASDGLTWVPADYEPDNIHPAASGENKVAAMLTGFFNGNAMATPWYLANNGADLAFIDAHKDAYVDAALPASNFGGLTELTWSTAGKRAYTQYDLSSVVDSVVYAKLSLRVLPTAQIASGEVVVVPNTTWNELTITAATAPPFAGAVLGIIPNASAGTAVSLDVTSAVQAAIAAAPGSAHLSLGIRPRPGPQGDQQVWSREGGDAPRLVLTTIPRATSIGRTPSAKRALVITTAPNPISDRARIAVTGANENETISATIVDVHGKVVRTLTTGESAGGAAEFVWDGRDQRARVVASGVYFVRAETAGRNGATATRKIVVVR